MAKTNRFIYILILMLLCSCFSYFFYFSAYAEAGILDYLDSKEITVIIGEAKPLNVNNPREVKIGNPSVLDVTGASPKELLLSGLSEGETSLSVVDSFGEHNYTVKIYQQDLEKIKERIDVLLEASGFAELNTKIGEKERKVFIIGKIPIADKESLEKRLESVNDKIVNLVEYDEYVPSVEIDVEVLDVAKTVLDDLGFDWTGKSFNLGSTRVRDIVGTQKIFKVLDDTAFNVTLKLAKERNKVRTISRPKVVCLSGKEATLLVGGERPIISGSTTTSGSGSSTTDYEVELKKYGIELKIQPVVKENDEIQISLNVKISDVDTTAGTQLTLSGGVSTPAFTERSVQTELTMLSGEVVFLAGLIKSATTDKRAGFAGLSSIPFLGALFRNKYYQNLDTEVVISLKPTIIKRQSAVNNNYVPEENLASPQKAPVMTSDENKQDPVFRYSVLVQNLINSNLKYPQELRKQGAEGSVKLSLHLLASGKLLGVLIMQSSGNALLDQTAEKTVKKLSPFPAFPSDVKLNELWLDIPIVYKAEGRS